MAEITLNDEFGQNIAKFCDELKLKKCLEIGSWDGTGSTKCFIEGMQYNDPLSLTCLEINSDRFFELEKNTQNYDFVYAINRSSISYNDMIHKDFDELWISPYNKIETDKETARGWFEADILTMQKHQHHLSRGFTYDGVLIDGSEFTGYSEYMLLKDSVNVFFLDDYYNAFKTRQAAWELNNDPDWEVIAGNKHLRNGYAIFKRKKFL